VDNLWRQLPYTPPYVLPVDEDLIADFNDRRSPQADVRIRTEHRPDPFIGPLDAPILILGLNPRYTSYNDAYQEEHAHLAHVYRQNLMHAALEYPFYPLDPDLEGSPIHTYWVTGYHNGNGRVAAALGQVIRACQPDGQYRVAQNILAVELGAYPSEHWSANYPTLPSQAYSNLLLQQAMDRHALIVIRNTGSTTNGWLDRFPKLKTYDRRYRFNSQNPSISARNCNGFDEIVDIIKTRTAPRRGNDALQRNATIDVAGPCVEYGTFWRGLLEKSKVGTALFSNVSPGTKEWLLAESGQPGIMYRYHITPGWAVSQIDIKWRGNLRDNKRIYGSLKGEIEAGHLDFECDETHATSKQTAYIKKAWRPGVNLNAPDSWSGLQRAMVNAMIQLADLLDRHT